MVRLLLTVLLLPSIAFAFINDTEIAALQRQIADKPIGERIAFWAGRFVGTPYDPDPLGEYVTRQAIVADDRVDCMYLTFRAVELAMSSTPEEAITLALDKRFITKGIVADGKAANYEERFQYAEDMLRSGRWGRDVTEELAETVDVEGSRGIKSVKIIQKALVGAAAEKMKSGDIVYFVKYPEKRVVGEIVGHIGIVSKGADGPAYLVHASGKKKAGGEVVRALLSDYAASMPFAGIIVGRF